MPDLVLTTFDWVPKLPRGFVRDLRIRWALEEAGLPYRVASVPFENRNTRHFAHQPFGQVPWLEHGDQSIFETGAILLHLGGLSERLMPADAKGSAQTVEWVFAALNSVEMAVLPWALIQFTGDKSSSPGIELLNSFVAGRLRHMDGVLAGREWLVDRFSVADILMADVLRLADRFGGLETYPACNAYMARATARPAYAKAHADQLAHFAAGDAARAAKAG
jgi:glutathione S-transferase